MLTLRGVGVGVGVGGHRPGRRAASVGLKWGPHSTLSKQPWLRVDGVLARRGPDPGSSHCTRCRDAGLEGPLAKSSAITSHCGKCCEGEWPPKSKGGHQALSASGAVPGAVGIHSFNGTRTTLGGLCNQPRFAGEETEAHRGCHLPKVTCLEGEVEGGPCREPSGSGVPGLRPVLPAPARGAGGRRL